MSPQVVVTVVPTSDINTTSITMTDNRGANLSRMVLKQAGRAKEKVGCSKVHSERVREVIKKALLQKCDHVKL